MHLHNSFVLYNLISAARSLKFPRIDASTYNRFSTVSFLLVRQCFLLSALWTNQHCLAAHHLESRTLLAEYIVGNKRQRAIPGEWSTQAAKKETMGYSKDSIPLPSQNTTLNDTSLFLLHNFVQMYVPETH